MTTKSKKIYLYALPNERNGNIEFHICDVKMQSEPDWVEVGVKEVTFDLPEVNAVIPEVVKGLEEKRDIMRAAASAAITEVDNRIASLLAIEHVEEDDGNL